MRKSLEVSCEGRELDGKYCIAQHRIMIASKAWHSSCSSKRSSHTGYDLSKGTSALSFGMPRTCSRQAQYESMPQATAMQSISTFTPLGNCLTAIQLRAGLWLNHFSYSAFISWKYCSLISNLYARMANQTYLHVCEIDTTSHDLLNRAARLLEDSFQVGAALARGGGDAVLDECARGVRGDLPGDVEHAVGTDGLGVGACCCLGR